MRKIPVIVSISAICGVFFVLWAIARLTHCIDVYTIPSASSAPTYQPGAFVFASKLKTPDRNTFISFYTDKKIIYLSRCIAKGGDMIEIKDAVVYLNGKRLDEPYAWNEYSISQKQYNSIRGYIEINKNSIRPINDSVYAVSLTNDELKRYHLNLKPYVAAKGIVDPELYSGFRYLKSNVDNFGPVKVPANCYFVMGDNPHNALDSRFIGFIKNTDLISTVIR
jgi:signal peptidase I